MFSQSLHCTFDLRTHPSKLKSSNVELLLCNQIYGDRDRTGQGRMVGYVSFGMARDGMVRFMMGWDGMVHEEMEWHAMSECGVMERDGTVHDGMGWYGS